MRHARWAASLLAGVALIGPSGAYKTHRNYSVTESPDSLFSIYGNRPDDCPPCFNCNLDDFVCHQYANCSKANGRCNCPPGFGGEDCSQPLCGALSDGPNRAPRGSGYCECKEGWEGINCNVCKTNQACNAMMPEGEGGVCLTSGQLVQESYQMCNITNRKIRDQLKDEIPQATFSCNAETEKCNFQCKLSDLQSTVESSIC